jgi:hypothetical protein
MRIAATGEIHVSKKAENHVVALYTVFYNWTKLGPVSLYT